jgi:hypothetical protein
MTHACGVLGILPTAVIVAPEGRSGPEPMMFGLDC